MKFRSGGTNTSQKFVDELIKNPSDIQYIRDYVNSGGLLILFYSERYLVATVFDWTFGIAIPCNVANANADSINSSNKKNGETRYDFINNEEAFGILLNNEMNSAQIEETGAAERTTTAHLICYGITIKSQLSPLFSVAEGKGRVLIVGQNANTANGYNWSQVLLHSIIFLSNDPVVNGKTLLLSLFNE